MEQAIKYASFGGREEMLAFRLDKRDGPTALLTQGANPGLASMFVKMALTEMARQLSIKVIHIAERDTQTTSRRKARGEFVNTWSVDGFAGEGLQPSELGWGSHERHWPDDAERHGYGCDAAIYLQRPGIATRVRSWTPLEGPYQGFLVTHGESISIADHLTLREEGRVTCRPTVHSHHAR